MENFTIVNAVDCEKAAITRIYQHMVRQVENQEDENLEQVEAWKVMVDDFENGFDLIANYFDAFFSHKKKRWTKKKAQPVTFMKPIDALKDAYDDLAKGPLCGSREKKQCDDLFEQLLSHIESGLERIDNKRASVPASGDGASRIIGQISFGYIHEILDLQDKDIIKLLPILMTAYVYNYRPDRTIHHAVKAEDAAPSYYSRFNSVNEAVKETFERVSQRCGFAGRKIRFKNDEKYLNSERGKENRPLARPIYYPSLKDSWVLELVFSAWCIIFCRINRSRKGIYAKISESVDIELCCNLFKYYIKGDGYRSDIFCFDEIIDNALRTAFGNSFRGRALGVN